MLSTESLNWYCVQTQHLVRMVRLLSCGNQSLVVKSHTCYGAVRDKPEGYIATKESLIHVATCFFADINCTLSTIK